MRAAKRRITGITGIALRTEELCNDSSEITAHSLGMRESCAKCGALLWKHERKWGTICCKNGKVDAPKFDYAPEGSEARAIQSMWELISADGRLMQNFSRQLNNVVCLAA